MNPIDILERMIDNFKRRQIRKKLVKARANRSLVYVASLSCSGVSISNWSDLFNTSEISYSNYSSPKWKKTKVPQVKGIEVQHFSDGSTEVLCPFTKAHHLNEYFQVENELPRCIDAIFNDAFPKKVVCTHHQQYLEELPEIRNLIYKKKKDVIGTITGEALCPYFRDVLRSYHVNSHR